MCEFGGKIVVSDDGGQVARWLHSHVKWFKGYCFATFSLTFPSSLNSLLSYDNTSNQNMQIVSQHCCKTSQLNSDAARFFYRQYKTCVATKKCAASCVNPDFWLFYRIWRQDDEQPLLKKETESRFSGERERSVYHQVLEELALEDPEAYRNFFRLSKEQVESEISCSTSPSAILFVFAPWMIFVAPLAWPTLSTNQERRKVKLVVKQVSFLW